MPTGASRARPGPRRPAVPRRTPLVLRRATSADLPLLLVHCRRMWEDIGGRSRAQIARLMPVYRRWVRREIAHRRFLAFVVEDPTGRVAGSGAIWISPVHPRPGRLLRRTMPYVLSMYTVPEFRGRGVASRIVRTMVRWAKTHGYRRIYLHASKQGLPVYARLGFVLGREMRREW